MNCGVRAFNRTPTSTRRVLLDGSQATIEVFEYPFHVSRRQHVGVLRRSRGSVRQSGILHRQAGQALHRNTASAEWWSGYSLPTSSAQRGTMTDSPDAQPNLTELTVRFAKPM